jgi:hypothetical protein
LVFTDPSTSQHLVTGLTANKSYTVRFVAKGSGSSVQVKNDYGGTTIGSATVSNANWTAYSDVLVPR